MQTRNLAQSLNLPFLSYWSRKAPHRRRDRPTALRQRLELVATSLWAAVGGPLQLTAPHRRPQPEWRIGLACEQDRDACVAASCVAVNKPREYRVRDRVGKTDLPGTNTKGPGAHAAGRAAD
jgi:hypothetical protein